MLIRTPLREQPAGHVRVCRGCRLLDDIGVTPKLVAFVSLIEDPLAEPGDRKLLEDPREFIPGDLAPEARELLLREPAAMRAWRRRAL